MAKNNNGSKVERVVVAMTALALNAPSTYTIAWSKDQHKEELPILYAGIGTSAITVLGAILGDKWFGTELMWGGLLATLGLFSYVSFVYKPPKENRTDRDPTVNTTVEPIILGRGDNGNAGFTHLMI